VSWRRRLSEWLWGYDYFISYRWKHGGPYAVALAQRLRDDGYDVFLDRAEFASGDDWREVAERALKRTQRLVLVATPEAVTDSLPVAHEVRVFADRGRQVIPIVFFTKSDDGEPKSTLAHLNRDDYAVLRLMPDSKLHIAEDLANLRQEPSKDVVEELKRTYRVMRCRDIRVMLVGGVVAVLGAFFAFALVQWANTIIEKYKAEEARKNEVRSFADAKRQTSDVYWQMAVSSRDRNHDPIRASHLFLRGEETRYGVPEAVRTARDVAFGNNLGLAASTGAEPLLRSFVHDGPVRGAQFSRDERRVLTWSEDQATVWDVDGIEPTQVFRRGGDLLGAQMSADGFRVLTWSADSKARLWQVGRTEPVTFEHDSVVGPTFSADLSRILTWDNGGLARLWAVNGLACVKFEHLNTIQGAELSPDVSRVLMWSQDGQARVWDVANRNQIQTFEHDNVVKGANFNSDATRVVTWSGDGRVRLWDLSNPKPIQTFERADYVKGVTLTPDDLRILTWGRDGKVRLWDTSKTYPVQTLESSGEAEGAAFSPNGARVLAWFKDGKAQVWNITSSKLIQVLNHDVSRIKVGDLPSLKARFSPDSSRVLTSSSDGTIQLWSETRKDPIVTLMHNARAVGTFSPGGAQALTWSNDGTARLWDLTAGTPVRTLEHEGNELGPQLGRQGSRVLTWRRSTTWL
jgi:WD40 repeat protein